MVFPRPVSGLGVLRALKKLGYRLLRLRKVLVKDLFFGAFVCLKRGSITLETASIHFSDPRQKVKGGFGLYNNGFLNGLFLVVLSMAILLGLDTDRNWQAIAKQTDQDWIRD